MNGTAISLLKEIINGTTDSKSLMEILGIKEWQFNEHVKKLLQDAFITKDGNVIRLQENAKTALLHEISKKWNLDQLLRGSNELVFSHLTEPVSVNDIVRNTGLSTATVYRAISDFEAIGAVKKEPYSKGDQTTNLPDKISIDSSKEPLMNLARILKTEREKMYEPDAEIIYKDEEKILRKVSKQKVTEGELTAFSLFSDYGIKYESPSDYYIKQERALDIHDVIIHSVLSAFKDNDKMALIMSIIFYVKNKNKTDTLTLRKISSSFGITDVWLDVEAYLRRKELKNKDLFLPWEEFVSKANLYDIKPDQYTLPQPASTLFTDISRPLKQPMKIYLLGGENMRLKNLKASTKDCDIVVENKSSYDLLAEILTTKLGYKPKIKIEFSEEDLRLYPDDIFIRDDKSRVDLFTKRIMKEMSLSNKMIETADYLDYGNLKVGILRNEYVFLLKAVACREGDIQDMAILAQGSANQPRRYQHGEFDWEEVWDEIIRQEQMNPVRNFTPDIFEQISNLADQTGIIPPILDRLRRYVIDLLVQTLLRGGKQPLKTIVSYLIGADISEQMVRNRVDALVKEDTISKSIIDKEIFVSLTEKAIFPYKEWELSPKNLEIYLGWRFPLKEPSSELTIKNFIENITAIGINSIGSLDEIIVNHLDILFEYEKEYFAKEPLKRVGSVKACIGLSDPKLGNNGTTPFCIINFEKFGKKEMIELVHKEPDRRTMN